MASHYTGWKPSCREGRRRISATIKRELPLFERSRMRLHCLLCAAGTRFHGQMALLRRTMRQGLPAKQSGHFSEGQR